MRKGIVVHKKSFHMRSGGVRKPKMTELSRRERMRKIQLFFVWLAGMLLAGLCVYFFLFSPYADIRDVVIESDPKAISREDIFMTVNDSLRGERGYVFSRKNFFIFSLEEARSALDERFLVLSNIRVEKRFPNAVHIFFSERKKTASWCTAEKCFLVDESGYAFGEEIDAESLKQKVEKEQPVIVDENRPGSALRDTVIDRDTLAQYLEWDDFLHTRLGDEWSALYRRSPSNFEEYRIRTQRGWEIRVAQNLPIEGTLRSLLAFLGTLPQERKDKLESIDLRIEGKVFFTEKKEGGEGGDPEKSQSDLGALQVTGDSGEVKAQSGEENAKSEKVKEGSKKKEKN